MAGRTDRGDPLPMFSFVFRGDTHPIGTMDRTVKEHPTTWSCWELPAVSTRTTEPNPLGARAGLPEVSSPTRNQLGHLVFVSRTTPAVYLDQVEPAIEGQVDRRCPPTPTAVVDTRGHSNFDKPMVTLVQVQLVAIRAGCSFIVEDRRREPVDPAVPVEVADRSSHAAPLEPDAGLLGVVHEAPVSQVLEVPTGAEVRDQQELGVPVTVGVHKTGREADGTRTAPPAAPHATESRAMPATVAGASICRGVTPSTQPGTYGTMGTWRTLKYR